MTSGSTTETMDVYLVTKQNWDGKLEFKVDYRDFIDFDISYSAIVVLNENKFKADVTPGNDKTYVWHDQMSGESNTKISYEGELNTFYIANHKRTEQLNPSESVSLSADIQITSNQQTLPKKVIKVEKGVFYEGSTDLYPDPDVPSDPDDQESPSESESDNSENPDKPENPENPENPESTEDPSSSVDDNENDPNNDDLNKNNNDPEEDDGLSGGEIAGIVIGCVAGVAIIAFCIVWFGVLKKGCFFRINNS